MIEFYESDETELYNLAEDLTESKNVAEKYPQVRDHLKAELTRWQTEMDKEAGRSFRRSALDRPFPPLSQQTEERRLFRTRAKDG